MTEGESTTVKFRAKVVNRDRWLKAADAAGKDFSTWAREVLDAAAGVPTLDLMQALKDSLAKKGEG